MKRQSVIIITICCIVAAFSIVPAFAGKNYFQSRNGGGNSNLTQEEIDDLKFMREEEKLARDVYLVQADVYGTDIFSKIAQSEQSHTDAVLGLIQCFGEARVDLRLLFVA